MIYFELFYVFFSIGLFTIGGGYAMIPMIEDQVVSRGWLSMEELMNFFAIAESTPGPFAVNTATLVGFDQGGILGAVIATLSVILPSFIIILIIAKFISNFLKYEKVKWALDGIKPIIVGMIAAVIVNLIFQNVLGGVFKLQSFDFVALGIITVILGLRLGFKKLNPIFIIILSGILGILFYHFWPL
ncbi:MAG TPA: chromate transporter [Acholeplasmatales bacterium]|nr:chromate transporter [Acholeplasmatales bacterium]